MTSSQFKLFSPPEPTLTHRSPTDARIFEQSTGNIWKSLSICSKKILAESGVKPEQVKGLGFDATCSLAVVDKQGKPVSISRAGQTEENEKDANLGLEGEWNVILWADHRAEEEAEKINSTGEGVLGFVGKTMSVSNDFRVFEYELMTPAQLEMEIPKTLWLSKHMAQEKFKQCMFFEYVSFLLL